MKGKFFCELFEWKIKKINNEDLFSQPPLLIFTKGVNISGGHCTYTYVDASLATVSIGRYTQAVRHIVMINLTSCTIVINEYSKMPQSCTAIGLRTHSMVNDVKLIVPRWRTRLHAWSSRMGHLYCTYHTPIGVHRLIKPNTPFAFVFYCFILVESKPIACRDCT